MSEWTLYWIFRLDVLHNVVTVAFIGTTLGMVFTSFFITLNGCTDGWDDKVTVQFKTILKKVLIPYIALIFLYIFTPSGKELAAIYVLPKVVESDVVQEDLPEIYELAKERLKELLTEENKNE